MGKFYNWLFNKEGKSKGAPYIAGPTLAVGVGGGLATSIAAAIKGDLKTLVATGTFTFLSASAVGAMYNADQPGTWLYRNSGGYERTK